MSVERKTKIAPAAPFEGAPKITMPSIIGASKNKPILFRIPVIGKRPLTYSVDNLPLGLTLKGNILSGSVNADGEYELIIKVENCLGKAEKRVTLEIKDQNVLVTPLLGFTSWNAFGSEITQRDIEDIADKMVSLGITEYGYSYVNTDSGWQGAYGGELDAIMPNFKFPDMKKMTDKIHSLGLKCGIYSTPMLTAWGCPKELDSIPGCTQGEPDYRYASINGGIGVIHKERNNALQWARWGFDYLKYDWAPTDTVNADLMRRELVNLDRDFGFCVTVRAIPLYSPYWSKYCSSYRSNPDTLGNWENLIEVYETYAEFREYACKGHYFDLDMLDFGTCKMPDTKNLLTEDEIIVQFSIRAFLSSPIQISSTLENASDFELSVYCNEEILAINQDCAFITPTPVLKIKDGDRYLDIYEKMLEDGSYAYAIFNFGNVSESISATAFADCNIRDLWAKEDIAHGEKLTLDLFPHTVKILKSDKQISFK